MYSSIGYDGTRTSFDTRNSRRNGAGRYFLLRRRITYALSSVARRCVHPSRLIPFTVFVRRDNKKKTPAERIFASIPVSLNGRRYVNTVRRANAGNDTRPAVAVTRGIANS